MRKLLVAVVTAGLALVVTAGPASADHDGQYCQAEPRSGKTIFVSPTHDYCE